MPEIIDKVNGDFYAVNGKAFKYGFYLFVHGSTPSFRYISVLNGLHSGLYFRTGKGTTHKRLSRERGIAAPILKYVCNKWGGRFLSVLVCEVAPKSYFYVNTIV